MKVCNKCKKEREEIEFSFRDKNLEIRKERCRVCDKEYHDEYYSKNRDKEIQRSGVARDIARNRNREYLIDYLANHPCIDCYETDIVVLEFDHITNNKYKSIAEMAWSCHSIKSIEKEIAKCVVRCANCHRRKTAKQFNWVKYFRSNNAGMT